MRQALDGPAPVGDVRLRRPRRSPLGRIPGTDADARERGDQPGVRGELPPDSDTGLVMTSVVSCLPMRMMIVRTLKGRLLRSGVVSLDLSLIHISEPTRLGMISYAVFC